MNKPVLAFALLVATHAAADPSSAPAFAPEPSAVALPKPAPSPWGTSPNVVAYQPPPEVDRSHRGLTLEVALGAGTTTLDVSTAGVTFALGLWVKPDVAVAFRVTNIGAYSLIGGSVQYHWSPSWWLGGGVGSVVEVTQLADYNVHENGAGAFARVGYNLAAAGAHAVYVSGEVQAAAIGDQTRTVALLALGYQLL